MEAYVDVLTDEVLLKEDGPPALGLVYHLAGVSPEFPTRRGSFVTARATEGRAVGASSMRSTAAIMRRSTAKWSEGLL